MPLKKFLKSVEEIGGQLKKKNDAAKEAPPHDESNWLISYADMMTLLCVFFVLMFSLSKIDEPRFEKVREQFVKQFGGDYKTANRELARFVTQVMQEAGIEKETVVKSDPLGISITFESAVFFDTLSAEIKPEGKEILTKLISAVSERQDVELKKYKIVVEGHTDSRPVIAGAYPSNWELSGARAATVIRMFLENGFTSDRLTAIGYADTRPAVAARTPAGELDGVALAKNRRVVLRILEPKVDAIPYPENVNTLTEEQNKAVSSH
ncbi:MAG: hypothetical protein A3K03_04395 [Bdellovibrionales bacterium RIFOXYD1_FULL_44_7]|nr:MAG: hypothetical protein A3K03_04395 [Bdellovibrionales bacterium RIFOXYD1_FULL_44_7]